MLESESESLAPGIGIGIEITGPRIIYNPAFNVILGKYFTYCQSVSSNATGIDVFRHLLLLGVTQNTTLPLLYPYLCKPLP